MTGSQRALELLREDPNRRTCDIAEECGITSAVVSKLRNKHGILIDPEISHVRKRENLRRIADQRKDFPHEKKAEPISPAHALMMADAKRCNERMA